MNLWQRFLCNVMGWHSPDHSERAGFNLLGINLHATCKRCKRQIMQDSQGNWF